MTNANQAAGGVVATTSEWEQTYARLCDLDPETSNAADFEALAEATFWLGKPRESLDARRYAYTAHKQAGDDESAARAAWLLFLGHFDLSEIAVAGGWVRRARQHARAVPDCASAGYVALAEADWARYEGALDDAIGHVDRAIEFGQRHNDADLVALGRATKGRVFVDQGSVTGGVGALDEAMVAAAGDELSRFATGRVYCLLVSTCHELGDVRRAGEWTAAAVNWCDQQGEDSWYPGLCRLHRCELESLRGEWLLAEQEALRAAKELGPFGDYWVGEGMYLVGEIRRHKGELAGAEEAYEEAHRLGRNPMPGLAVLRAEKGDTEGAVKTLRLELSRGGGTPLRRARLLAAHVWVELEAGNVEAASQSAQELIELSAATGMMLLRGMARRAEGAVLLAQGEVDAALTALRTSCEMLRDLSCPYEEAHSRLLIARAMREAGDERTAQLESGAAATTFEELGATLDAERAFAFMNRKAPLPRGLTEREVEVLAQVAKGQTNREIGESLFISEHTVARHLSNVFRKLDVTSRSAAAAFALDHDLT